MKISQILKSPINSDCALVDHNNRAIRKLNMLLNGNDVHKIRRQIKCGNLVHSDTRHYNKHERVLRYVVIFCSMLKDLRTRILELL